MMNIVSSTGRRARQHFPTNILPISVPLPRAVRVVCVERGLVLAIGSSTTEVRRLLSEGGAHA